MTLSLFVVKRNV